MILAAGARDRHMNAYKIATFTKGPYSSSSLYLAAAVYENYPSDTKIRTCITSVILKAHRLRGGDTPVNIGSVWEISRCPPVFQKQWNWLQLVCRKKSRPIVIAPHSTQTAPQAYRMITWLSLPIYRPTAPSTRLLAVSQYLNPR
jgi:hypothetical protein